VSTDPSAHGGLRRRVVAAPTGHGCLFVPGQAQVDLFASPAAAPAPPSPSPLEQALAQLQPDTLSPREALEALYRLKALQKDAAP